MLILLQKIVAFILGTWLKKRGKLMSMNKKNIVVNHDEQDDKYITKHFDFRLDGNINGSENSRQNDFAYAYFRDELKGKVNKGEKCNPDINIEQKWGRW